MASAAPDPVRGTVDLTGRLTAADPRLARLQEEAGGGLGAMLAVPQLAAIVQLARQLGVTLSRQALAATSDLDLDLWVRAEPGPEGVQLSIESWVERPPRGRRFRIAEPGEAGADIAAPDLISDAELRLVALSPAAGRRLGLTAAQVVGQPLTRLFDLQPGSDGDLPLLGAAAGRRAFARQPAELRATAMKVTLSGEPRLGPDCSFLGFALTVVAASAPAETAVLDDGFDALLREPLDVIMDEAERIAGKGDGPLRSDYAGYATDIAGAAKHLLDVLRAMGQEPPAAVAEPIDLAALALEAAGLVQPQATQAGVSLELDGATALPALGEGRSVTQILVNLIGNAIRHSPEGGVVNVTAAAGSDVSITVADQGPGIALADQQRIFERFEQAEPRGQGAGLGLAISRRLAQKMGGDIMLTSTPGAGAAFTLRLPAA